MVIAASNSSDKMKKSADYVCTGTDDQIIINEALAEVFNDWGNSGEVVLLNGDYSISDSIILKEGVDLVGKGGYWPIIKFGANPSTDKYILDGTVDYECYGYYTLKNLYIANPYEGDFSHVVGGLLTDTHAEVMINKVHFTNLPLAMHMKGLYQSWIINSFFDLLTTGIKLEEGTWGNGINADIISNNHFTRTTTGINLVDVGSKALITSNFFDDITTPITGELGSVEEYGNYGIT